MFEEIQFYTIHVFVMKSKGPVILQASVLQWDGGGLLLLRFCSWMFLGFQDVCWGTFLNFCLADVIIICLQRLDTFNLLIFISKRLLFFLFTSWDLIKFISTLKKIQKSNFFRQKQKCQSFITVLLRYSQCDTSSLPAEELFTSQGKVFLHNMQTMGPSSATRPLSAQLLCIHVLLCINAKL